MANVLVCDLEEFQYVVLPVLVDQQGLSFYSLVPYAHLMQSREPAKSDGYLSRVLRQTDQ